MAKEEDEIILQLLGIHPDLMEMIQIWFKVVTEDEKFKWKLPKRMASYANKYFTEFIPKGDLKEAVLKRSPLPENMDSVKKLDDFLKDLLKEKRKLMSKI